MTDTNTQSTPPVVGVPAGDPEATGRHRAGLTDPTVRDLSLQLGIDVSRLMRAEAQLALLEGKQRARRAAIGAGMFGASGLAAFLGACCVVEAFILALSNVTRPWFAALIAAAVLFVLAGLIVLPGWKGVRERRPITTDLTTNIKADVEAVRKALPG